MKKLFINGEYKGNVKRVFCNTKTGMWLYLLSDSDIDAIAIRDDEILGFATSSEFAEDINLILKDTEVPAGMDADYIGETISNII